MPQLQAGTARASTAGLAAAATQARALPGVGCTWGGRGRAAPDASGRGTGRRRMGGAAADAAAGCEPVTGLPEPWLRGVLAPGMDCVDVTGGAPAGVLSPVSSPSPRVPVRTELFVRSLMRVSRSPAARAAPSRP